MLVSKIIPSNYREVNILKCSNCNEEFLLGTYCSCGKEKSNGKFLNKKRRIKIIEKKLDEYKNKNIR